ncbi:unnamed protein product [Amoebophrya sp. A120]|nr:unnamed protein product [Amoebophrya sp. A120]|eukprot:GSA120T00024785001.1
MMGLSEPGGGSNSSTADKYDPIDTLMKCKSTIRQLNSELEKEKADHAKLKREATIVGKELVELKGKVATLENEKEKWRGTYTELEKVKNELQVAKRELADTRKQAAANAQGLGGVSSPGAGGGDLLKKYQASQERVSQLEAQKQTLEELKDRLLEDVKYLEDRSAQYELTVNPIVNRQKQAILQLEERIQQLEEHCHQVEGRLQHERETLRDYYEQEILDLREDYEHRKQKLQLEHDDHKQNLEEEKQRKHKECEEQVLAVERLYEKAREEHGKLKEEHHDSHAEKDRHIADLENKHLNEKHELHKEKESIKSDLLNAEQKLQQANEALSIRTKLHDAKHEESVRLSQHVEHLEGKHEEKVNAITCLQGEKKELNKRIELLERLNEKHERSSKTVVRQLEAEVLQLKTSLEKSEQKNDEGRRLLYDHHKLQMQHKELTALLDQVRKDTQDKYENVITKLSQQNTKLKRESATLAANLNHHLVDRDIVGGSNQYSSPGKRRSSSSRYNDDYYTPSNYDRNYNANDFLAEKSNPRSSKSLRNPRVVDLEPSSGMNNGNSSSEQDQHVVIIKRSPKGSKRSSTTTSGRAFNSPAMPAAGQREGRSSGTSRGSRVVLSDDPLYRADHYFRPIGR